MLFTTRLCLFGYACITSIANNVVGVELAPTYEQALFQAMIRFEKVKSKKELDVSNVNTELVTKVLQVINGNLSEKELINNITFMIGTSFQHQVWRAIVETNIGETITYTDIANKILRPNAVRAIGTACGQNPLAILVPCHRVIKSNNDIGQYHWGVELKKVLLQREQFLKPVDWKSVDKALEIQQAAILDIQKQVDAAIATAKSLLLND